MYNHTHIIAFIEESNRLAEIAAQEIFDARQPKLEEMIKSQMRAGDRVLAGMGSVSIEDKKGREVGEELSSALTCTQYPAELSCGFNITDFKKQ